ncbi:MAG: 4Fe-4S dicluster domain-containing protein [Candidatus Krumholzibacteriia bacterium]
MSDRGIPLHPWPLESLLGRIDHEWTTRREIFSLAGRRFFRADPDVDLGWTLDELKAATPVGPAAGPHTQLAQNIVLGWLAGARSFELKTVQVLDELDIPRPCIDMENVGYNVEWSQELKLRRSLEEYVKSWVMLAVLKRWEPLRAELGDTGDHVFELSVGYDLAGVQSTAMTDFISGLRNPGAMIDGLRREISGPFAHLRDVEVPETIVRTATLSTFHGCPPDQIEGIVKHLMSAHGLDVTVKLNPTLLGMEVVREILQDRLGYTDIVLAPEAFAEDLKFDRALEMIDRLRSFAAGCGRRFGIKLTNTLVVENRRGVMPGDRMYLSGRPLHVLAMTLLEKLHTALPGVLRLGLQDEAPVPVAFSAGIDKDNLQEAVALGLLPVTICSDLLRPGGYGRMAQGLRKLVRLMKENGLADLAALRRRADAEARVAGHRDAVEAAAARLAAAAGCARYSLTGSEKPLRRVDHVLEMFDCVACTNCVTVCPNNAFVSVPTSGVEGLAAREQYAVLAELCNDCGNCTTFCPEEGAPQRVKPRLYTMPQVWESRGREGFLLQDDGGAVAVSGEGEVAARLAELLDPETLPVVLPGAR